jgi:hypothetical protein
MSLANFELVLDRTGGALLVALGLLTAGALAFVGL